MPIPKPPCATSGAPRSWQREHINIIHCHCNTVSIGCGKRTDVASSDKPVWEYADFATAARKLKAIAEDEETKQRFDKYLEEAPKELWIWAYRERVKRIGKAALTAYFKEWRIRNPERYAKLQRESYEKHYAKNYPRYLANSRNWRARKKLADGAHTSEEIGKMVRDQRGVCAYCESELKGNYHVDHLIPLSRGGRNDWSNLAVTCDSCNRSKGTMTAEEFFQAMRKKRKS